MGLFIDTSPTRSRGDKAKNALRNKGWTKSTPTHGSTGNPILPIVHAAYLELLNYNIEDMFLSKNIYPGARLMHPHLGIGTVVSCRITRPPNFSFIPDTELDVDETGTLQMIFYNPEALHPGWGFATKGCEDWSPCEVDSDEDVLKLSTDHTSTLVHLSKDMSTWQLGQAIIWMVGELKKKTK